MDIDEEQKYEHTIDQIIGQLEHLIMEILLTSVKRVKSNYEQMLNHSVNQDDDFQF